MKKKIWHLLRTSRMMRPLRNGSRVFSSWSRAIASQAHRLQYFLEWTGSDDPEYFDHFIDAYYLWPSTKSALPWERGVFSAYAIQSNFNGIERPRVLELCCGDGFMTNYFYSLHAEEIIAVDFDPIAIGIAQKRNLSKNVDFKVCDIRNSLPIGQFNNVVWDAAIEHFTESEIDSIMRNIRESLTNDGILSGYTVLENESGAKHLHQHEYEFKSKDDLARFFSPYFTNVQILETQYPSRSNLYFYATNGELPLLGSGQLTIKN